MVNRVLIGLSTALLLSLPGCFSKKQAAASTKTTDSASKGSKKLGGTIKFDDDAEEFYLEEDEEGNIFEDENVKGARVPEIEFESMAEAKAHDGERVQFQYDSAAIQSTEKPKIERNTKKIKEVLDNDPNAMVVCRGHSCKITRSKAYNLQVSNKRANEVAKEYVAHGVPATKVKAVGCGTTELLTDADGMEAQGVNRRAETEFAHVK